MRAHAIAAVLIAAAVIAPRAEAGRGTASLKYLADKTDAVVIVDVAKGRKSPVFRKGFELASDKLPLLGTVKLAQIDTVIVGRMSSDDTVIVVEGKVDALLADAKKRSTASGTHGAVTFWTTAEGDVALIDKRLVIATIGTMGQVIDRAADKKRAKGPARVRTWLAGAAGAPTIVVAAAPAGQVAKDLAKQFGAAPQVATISLGMTSHLTFELRAVFGDDATAASAEAALTKAAAADTKDRLEAFVGKDFADSIQVDRDGGTVRGSAVMTADEVDKVLGVARMLM